MQQQQQYSQPLSERAEALQERISGQRAVIGAALNQKEQTELLLDELAKASKAQEKLRQQIELQTKRIHLLTENLRVKAEALDFRDRQRKEAEAICVELFDSADLHTKHTVNTVLGCLQQRLQGKTVNDANDLLVVIRSRLLSALGTLRRRLVHSANGSTAIRLPFQAWGRISRRHARCDRMLLLAMRRRRWFLKQQGFSAFARCAAISNTRFVLVHSRNQQNRLLLSKAFHGWNTDRLRTGYHTAVVENMQLRSQHESARNEREVLYETLREKEYLQKNLEEKVSIQAATLDRASSMQELSLQEMEREIKELREVIASQDQSLNDLHKKLRNYETENVSLQQAKEQLEQQHEEDSSLKSKYHRASNQYMVALEELEESKKDQEFLRAQLERAHANVAEERRKNSEIVAMKNEEIETLKKRLGEKPNNNNNNSNKKQNKTVVARKPEYDEDDSDELRYREEEDNNNRMNREQQQKQQRPAPRTGSIFPSNSNNPPTRSALSSSSSSSDVAAKLPIDLATLRRQLEEMKIGSLQQQARPAPRKGE